MHYSSTGLWQQNLLYLQPHEQAEVPASRKANKPQFPTICERRYKRSARGKVQRLRFEPAGGSNRASTPRAWQLLRRSFLLSFFRPLVAPHLQVVDGADLGN